MDESLFKTNDFVFQDLQIIGIETRGHRQKLLRDIRKIPRVDIEEDIPVSSFNYSFDTKGKLRLS